MKERLLTALTFDDGPSVNSTSELLDILAKHAVSATFFCIGSRAKQHREIIPKIAAGGHEIGSHSWSHKNFRHLSDEEFFYELNETHALISDLIGKPPSLLRPPYGIISQQQRDLARHWFGYSTVLWNVDTNDWKRPGVDTISLIIRQSLGSGKVILLHDTHKDTITAIAQALSKIECPDQEFATVSQLRQAIGVGD